MLAGERIEKKIWTTGIAEQTSFWQPSEVSDGSRNPSSMKYVNIKERKTLLNRLDQMIEMQKKQEENLTYFKEFFETQNSESRRIKTQQSQPPRKFGKSAYMENLWSFCLY